MNTSQNRTWLEIDLGRIEHNYRALRALTDEHCRFAGIVKADAYGHGAVPVAQVLEKAGADYLAVACLDEAVELRAAGITMPILILGVTPSHLCRRLLALDLTQAVSDLRSARIFSEIAESSGRKLRVHIKTDTGMSRTGFLCDEQHLSASAEEIAEVCALPGLIPEGIFTHFAAADGSEEYTMRQFTRFLDLLDLLAQRGISFPIRHCAAGAATLNYPSTALDMIRPGITLYGHLPDPSCDGVPGLELLPVMTMKTRVTAVRSLPAGTSVSYGCTVTLTRDSRVAVLGIGYADGLPRLLSGRGEVWLHGTRCPILGRICMDMCMVDVTGLEHVHVGDEVEIFGDNIPVEELADLIGTIPYELLCGVDRPRIPKVYLGTSPEHGA